MSSTWRNSRREVPVPQMVTRAAPLRTASWKLAFPARDSGFPAGMTRETATRLSPHRRRSDRGWGAAADSWRRRRASIGHNLVQGLGGEHALGPAQQGLGISRFDPLRDGRG